MKHDSSALHSLIHACLDGSASADEAADLNALLRQDAAARDVYLQLADIHSCMAIDESLWVPEPAVAGGMRHYGMTSPALWFSWRAAAAGLVFGVLSASVVWAGVVLLRHEPEPVRIPLADQDFETVGLLAVGGFPKRPGLWRGDAATVVTTATNILPHSGVGMLQFLHSDGVSDGEGRELHASDQWQLVDITAQRSRLGVNDGAVAELEAWFNSSAAKREERGAFIVELYAMRAASATELSAISSFWLQQSNLVVAAGTRRLVVDTEPTTWERVAVDLPVPAEAKYLLVHLSAYARPGALPGRLFPGEFADSVALKLRPRLRDAGPIAAQ